MSLEVHHRIHKRPPLVTCPYPEPDEYIPRPPPQIPCLLEWICSIYDWLSIAVTFPSLQNPPGVSLAPRISSSWIWCVVRSTNRVAPYCAVFFGLLLPPHLRGGGSETCCDFLLLYYKLVWPIQLTHCGIIAEQNVFITAHVSSPESLRLSVSQVALTALECLDGFSRNLSAYCQFHENWTLTGRITWRLCVFLWACRALTRSLFIGTWMFRTKVKLN